MKISESFINSIYIAIHITIFATMLNCQVSNVAKGKNAYQGSNALSNEGGAHLAIDGNFDQYWSGQSCSHTETEYGAFWEVDLEDVYVKESVSLYIRMDDCCTEINIGIEVHFGMTSDTYRVVGYEEGHIYTSHRFGISPPAFARWIRITRNPDVNSALMICEVAVNGFKSNSRSFKRISNVKGTGNSLVTIYARSTEQCCYICFNTQDCLAVTMNGSHCSLLNSDNYSNKAGQTLYVIY